MAKKTKRINLYLQCSECSEQNYITSKNTENIKNKLELKKFCSRCRKSTVHKEVKIPKPKK